MPDIRYARAREEALLMSIMRAAIRDGCAEAYGRDVVAAWTAEDNRIFEYKMPDRTLVLEHDGEVVGFSGWTREPDDQALLRISAVFVAPRHRGKGFGARLLQAAEKDARANGAQRLHLVATRNAERFYRAAGYRDLETIQIPLAEGMIGDFLVMCRDPEV